MRAGAFVLLVLLAAAVSGVIAWVAPTARVAMQCNQTSHPGTFLGYCESTFGDYEHAAYGLDLERSALDSLEKADVVVLGSSLIQFALSSNTTSRYFAEHGLRHYLFGFGFNEGSAFPLSIISHLDMKAKVYILHTYGTFTSFKSKPALQIEEDGAWFHGLRRKIAVETAATICTWFRCGPNPAYYRDEQNGHWLWARTLRDPVGPNVVYAASAPRLQVGASDKAGADRILHALPVEPQCIIITTTPSPTDDPFGYAAEIAAYLHATPILPHLEGLRGIDRAHLDRESAERWSAEFLRLADATIRRCTSKSRDNTVMGPPRR